MNTHPVSDSATEAQPATGNNPAGGTRFSARALIDASQKGDNDLSGLGPNTELVMGELGILDLDVEVKSSSPQSASLSFYHDFANPHAPALDATWVDCSNFTLSEFYFNGEAFAETEAQYNEVYGVSASYTWRWFLIRQIHQSRYSTASARRELGEFVAGPHEHAFVMVPKAGLNRAAQVRTSMRL